ncbi:MAG: glycosyltransferase family 4 protein [Candidatus Methanomethylicia archaeon]
MKILIIAPTPLTGGVKIYVENIISKLKLYEDLTFTIINYPLPKQYFWSLAYEQEKLGRKIANNYKDVDVVHSLVTYVAFLGLTISYELGVPHIASIHTIVSDEYYIKYSLRGIGTRAKSKIIKNLIKKFESRVTENSIIITFSNMNKQKICNSFNVSENNVKVIYHGSDHVPEMTISSNRKDISSGVLSEIKGVDILIEIARKLPNLKFIVTGENRLSSKLKIKLPPNIAYTGYIHDLIELYRLIASTKLYVLPSRYEAFSIATLEAMRLGVVPLVSEYVGLKEILLENNLKLVLSLSNIKLWADSINDLYQTDLAYQSSKVMNIARKFSWSESARQHMEVYMKTKQH